MVLSRKPTWLNPFCSILTIVLTSGRKKTTAAHKTFCENNYIEILFAKEDEQDKKSSQLVCGLLAINFLIVCTGVIIA